MSNGGMTKISRTVVQYDERLQKYQISKIFNMNCETLLAQIESPSGKMGLM